MRRRLAALLRAGFQSQWGSGAWPVAPLVMTERDQARLRGYEGDPCSECGSLTLVRSGACMKCDTCGSTSGCS